MFLLMPHTQPIATQTQTFSQTDTLGWAASPETHPEARHASLRARAYMRYSLQTPERENAVVITGLR